MPSRSWQFRIDDIIEAINKIERYTYEPISKRPLLSDICVRLKF